MNLIDGVDGLAVGVCATSGAHPGDRRGLARSLSSAGVLAALTAGGALGFLRHGFPPASSFMGDTGSNLLGFLLGVIAVQGALKTNAVVALVFPLVVLAVPILDTGFVIAKRIKYRAADLPGGLAGTSTTEWRTSGSPSAASSPTPTPGRRWPALALALRFVPYSRRRGTSTPLDRGDRRCWWLALAASIYLVVALEILKLARRRFRGAVRPPAAPRTAGRGDRRGGRQRARDRQLPRRRSGRPASSRSSIPPRRGPRGRSSDCYKRVTGAPAERPLFLYSRRRRRVLALFRDGRLSRPWDPFLARCLVASSTSPMTETPSTRAVATTADHRRATHGSGGTAAAVRLVRAG